MAVAVLDLAIELFQFGEAAMVCAAVQLAQEGLEREELNRRVCRVEDHVVEGFQRRAVDAAPLWAMFTAGKRKRERR
jgi:hypothetical protein